MVDRLLAGRLLIVGLFICILAVAGYGASSLSIDPNNRVFFSQQHEHYANLLDLEVRFGSNTNLLYLIVSDKPLLDSSDLPRAIRWLTHEVRRIDRVTSVGSAATYPHVSGSRDELLVENLLDFVCPETVGCMAERASALNKPHLVGRIVSEDGNSFSVVADVDLLDPTSSAVTETAQDAAELKAEFNRKFPALSLYLTGGVPMMQAFFDAAQRDSESLIVLAIVVLTVGLYFFLGGVLPAGLMVLLGSSSVVVTLGIAGWFGYVINTATATVPLIVFTLVVASAMHVFLHVVREEGNGSKEDLVRAVKSSVAANWRPVLLTAGTTAIGLLSMVFVSAPPLRELGILSACGVVVGALFSLTVVPCLFTYLPRLRGSDWLAWLQGAMNRYAKWIEHSRPTMAGASALFVLALSGLANISIDEDFVRYFSSGTEFRQDTEAITAKLASPYHVDVVYDSGRSAGVYSARSIRDLENLVQFLRQDPRVVNVASIIDVLRETSSTMAGSRALGGRPAEELAQYFLSYELSLNIGQSMRDLVDSDYRRSKVSVLLNDVSMAQIRQFAEATKRWAAAEDMSERLIVSGEGIPTAYLSSESIREMGLGILVSIIVSAVLVGLYFRDLRVSIVMIFATVVPILAGFGAWGWIESEIGIAAVLVVAITIGVVIDDTIHLTYRYVDSYRNLDLTPWGATAYSIHKTGTALVVTSLVLVGGLLVLLGSEFRMNSTFGACSSLVILLALLYNLTIAPHFLKKLN